MNYKILMPTREDAEEMFVYLHQVGSETDFLLFGEEGIPMSLEEERNFLENINKSEYSRMFIIKDAEKIIANGFIRANPRLRIKHKAEIAISVLKPYWGKGVGSLLLKALIDYAKSTGIIETIYLDVVSENTRAIKLYEKFGFVSYGVNKHAAKVNDKYYDWLMMRLDLN
jgi:RimJ/RimL family protein N-acetyltransferase